uniref:Secreted protein n=1 Tax=Macrostomum lignano TaxID=282301 RepID=A0A1I8FP24_9PLAT
MSHQAMKLRMLMTQLLNLMDIDSLEMSTAHRAQTLPSPYRNWGPVWPNSDPCLRRTCAVRTCRSAAAAATEPAASSSRLISVQPRPAGIQRTFAVNINSGSGGAAATIKATTNSEASRATALSATADHDEWMSFDIWLPDRPATPELCWARCAERADHRVRRASGDDTPPIPPPLAAGCQCSDELCSSAAHLALTISDWLDFSASDID